MPKIIDIGLDLLKLFWKCNMGSLLWDSLCTAGLASRWTSGSRCHLHSALSPSLFAVRS